MLLVADVIIQGVFIAGLLVVEHTTSMLHCERLGQSRCISESYGKGIFNLHNFFWNDQLSPLRDRLVPCGRKAEMKSVIAKHEVVTWEMLGVDRKIILKWALKMSGMWLELVWLRICSNVDGFWIRYWTSVFDWKCVFWSYQVLSRTVFHVVKFNVLNGDSIVK